jgi:hypothetical protein
LADSQLRKMFYKTVMRVGMSTDVSERRLINTHAPR